MANEITSNSLILKASLFFYSDLRQLRFGRRRIGLRHFQ